MNSTKEKINEIFEYLQNKFPNPKCELNYSNNFELLCAVILSAQCTDKRVNLVTPALFSAYPTPETMAKANKEELENIIRSCGFYHNKSYSLINMSKSLVEKFNGIVPSNFDDLVSLQGVGQKTANVVLAVGFNQNEMGVDTHIFRISHRLNLSQGNTPAKVEQDLRELFVGRDLKTDHYLLVLFGRYQCKAISPNCENCALKKYCSYEKKVNNKSNKNNKTT